MSETAYRFTATVGPSGKLEMQVPVAEGTQVEVLVLTPEVDDFADLVELASKHSLDFWDNPEDDAEWNNA
jgi:hypothetical protein